jgi:hypothetical protein
MRRLWHKLGDGCAAEPLLEELPRAVDRPRAQSHSDRAAQSVSRRRPSARVAVLVVALTMICGGAALATTGAGAAPSVTNRDLVYPASSINWSAPAQIDANYPYQYNENPLATVSCASTTACLAVTGGGGESELLGSTQPTGTSASDWSVLSTSLIAQDGTGYSLSGASCMTVGSGPFCLATGYDSWENYAGSPFGQRPYGVILTTTDPTGGAADDWVHSSLPQYVYEPTCAASGSNALCAVISGSNGDDIEVSSNPAAATPTWTAIAPPYAPTDGNYPGTAAVECPSTTFCAALSWDGQFVVSSNPADPSSWSAPEDAISAFFSGLGLSCPTTTLCVAWGLYDGDPDNAFVVETTTDPGSTSGAGAGTSNATWDETVPTALSDSGSLSCSPDASVSSGAICFATGGSSGPFVSTDGGQTWTAETVTGADDSADDISCAGDTLCLAATSGGAVANSADASSLASATWSAPLSLVAGVNEIALNDESCPSTTLCIATDSRGRILTSTDFAEGASSWHATLADTDADGYFSPPVCRGTSLCVAVDGGGNVLTSTDPTGGGTTWSTPVNIDTTGLQNVVCPSTSLCIALDSAGDVLTSTDPSGGDTDWSAPANIDTDDSDGVALLACPSAGLCIATDDQGNLMTSTDPAAGAASWSTPVAVDTGQITTLTCPSTGLCIATDDGGGILESTNPHGGAATWSAPASIAGDGFADYTAVATLTCASSNLCVGVEVDGNMVVSTDPAGGAGTWSDTGSIGDNFTELVCPSASLCVAGDFRGNVLTTSDPAGGSTTWSEPTSIDPDGVSGLACPSASLCVASDGYGNVLVGGASANPASTSPPTITGTTTQGQILTEHHATWTNGPIDGYGYDWERCNASGDNCAAITDATDSTYQLTSADVGSTVRIAETATNGDGSGGPATSAQTAVVAPLPPSNTSPPTISGGTTQGDTLTEGHGAWSNGVAGYTYQWERCNSAGSACAAIGSASGRTYQLAGADVGSTLRVQETASNSAGPGTPATSTQTAVIQGPGSGGSGGGGAVVASTPPPPPTALLTTAKISSHKHSASFAISAQGDTTSYECALVKVPKRKHAKTPSPQYRTCAASENYKHLSVGTYIFYVRAIGPGGPGTPVTHRFKIS